jgi:hypothetical protein
MKAMIKSLSAKSEVGGEDLRAFGSNATLATPPCF